MTTDGRQRTERGPIRLGADPDHLTWVRWVWPRRIGSHVWNALFQFGERIKPTAGEHMAVDGEPVMLGDRPPPNGTAPPASTPSGRLM